MKPESLDALFAKDPILLTDAEVARIVEYLQGLRKEFLTTPAATKSKKPKAVEAPANLSIEDLQL